MSKALPIVLLLSVLAGPARGGDAALDEAALAVQDGRCAEAVSLLEPLMTSDTLKVSAHRVLGDAFRCLGSAREAVLAYRRYLDGGGDPDEVVELVATLRERLGRLRVVVRTERPAPVRVSVQPLAEDPVAATMQPDGTWLIEDLEPGTEPTVTVRGTGVQETKQGSRSIPRGGEVELVVVPRWMGIGVLELTGPPPEGASVEVLETDGWAPLPAGKSRRVTAGAVAVAVVGPQGRVETTVQVPADAPASFDPAPWVPTRLTVRGVPAGERNSGCSWRGSSRRSSAPSPCPPGWASSTPSGGCSSRRRWSSRGSSGGRGA